MIGGLPNVLVSVKTLRRIYLVDPRFFNEVTIMTDERIEEIWNEIEDIEPDISTERLMAMTVERVSEESGEECDNSIVADALYRRSLKRDRIRRR